MKTPNLILTAAVQFALIISIPAFAHTELHGTEEPDHEQVSTEFGGFHSGLIPTRTVEIKMYDSMEFEPTVINVKSNEVIKFLVLNLGELDHEFMFGNQEIVSPMLPEGHDIAPQRQKTFGVLDLPAVTKAFPVQTTIPLGTALRS